MENKKKAAALLYNENYEAPVLIGKGLGHVADNIIRKAKENDVPVVYNEEMADLLQNADMGEYIPEELYQAVSEILIFIMKL